MNWTSNRLALPAITLLILGLASSVARAQDQGLTVVVEHLAGSDIYINAGLGKGVSQNDTLFAYTEAGGAFLGSFVVTSSSAERSIVRFAQDPFPVTRGNELYIVLTSPVTIQEATPAAERRPPRQSPTYSPQISGRLSVDVSTLHSTIEGREVGAQATRRSFTTPTMRLRTTVTHLPGDVRLHLNVRASARYSSDLIEPAESFRVYQANAEKSFERVPVQLKIGRFYNTYETYSGYWDGLLLHVGGDGLGVGAAVGFQPERSDELFSGDLPKYTVFVNYGYRFGSVRYETDVSFHEVRPRNGLPTERFGGWTQRLRVGRFQLSHDLEVDRDRIAEKWVMTRLHVRSSIPFGRHLSLHARYSRRRPGAPSLIRNIITLDRDQVGGGLSYWTSVGSINLEVTTNTVEGRERSLTYSGSFSAPHTILLGIGFSGSASYWSEGDTKALYVAGGLNRAFGRVQWRASYQRYRTESPFNTVLTHSGDVALNFPLTRRLFSLLQLRLQRGDNLNSTGVYGGIWMNF